MKSSPFSPLPPVQKLSRVSRFSRLKSPGRFRFRVFSVFCGLSLFAVTGCQVLTYSSPTGERFSRSSFGANTSIHSLTVEAGTNGIRKVHVNGYENNSTEALGAVTDAAVKAAIQSAKP